MALLPGFEYDIFISYRHNDNLDGWVSGFVEALEKELKATIKEPVSIYFDKNPHDGLLETHHVDKSLEGKLKCLIFIPIISQTYCDEKSFAWQQEFCVFNALAKGDELGRDVRLLNGNVASRILPVKVHDLDATDKATVEKEMGGALRAIEFIYKEPGVNRPLKPTDNRSDNQIKTDYRNQINKVANAVKELMTALKSPQSPATTNHHQLSTQPSSSKKKIWVALAAVLLLATVYFFYQQRTTIAQQPPLDKSIAVLPFTNMTNDSTQNYFTDGMADDILNHLSKIADLRVKSRTSTLQYRNTSKTMPQIAEELGAGTILEGSVRKVGNQVRIVVQLIDARNDVHIWSETYDRPLEDVLKLQSEIAMEVATRLKTTLTEAESNRVIRYPTTSLDAYDLYLKAKAITGIFAHSEDRRRQSKRLLNQAIKIDPRFAQAYAKLSGLILFQEGDARQSIDSASLLASMAITLEPELAEAHFATYSVLRAKGKLMEAYQALVRAHELDPNNAEIMWTLGFYLLRDKKYDEGARMQLRSVQLQKNTSSADYLVQLGLQYQWAGENEKALSLFDQAQKLEPDSKTPSFQIGNLYYLSGNYEKAAEYFSKPTDNLTDRILSLYYLGDSYYYQKQYAKADSIFSLLLKAQRPDQGLTATPVIHKLGYIKSLTNHTEGRRLLLESIHLNKQELNGDRITYWNDGTNRYNLSATYAYLGNKHESLHYLDSALLSFGEEIELDPLFDGMRNDPDFIKIYQAHLQFEKSKREAMKKALRKFEAGTL